MLFVAHRPARRPEVLGEIDLATRLDGAALAEATLALVLFSDASRIDLGALRRDVDVPVRLLGDRAAADDRARRAGRGRVFGALSVAEALILAVLLAPTDAALGQAVVTDPRLPSRIRQGLNVESGLNDGICVPLLFIALAVADVDAELAGGRTRRRCCSRRSATAIARRRRRRRC